MYLYLSEDRRLERLRVEMSMSSRRILPLVNGHARRRARSMLVLPALNITRSRI
jgi:hypothetical protein